MLKNLIQPAKPKPVTPRGFVKVTNRRRGEILLPCPPGVFPPGVSYHAVEVCDAISEKVADALRGLLTDGDLVFEAADVAPPEAPAPAPYLPPIAPEHDVQKIPALSTDTGEALEQIAKETDQTVLGSWFDSQPPISSELSAAILNRHSQLNP